MQRSVPIAFLPLAAPPTPAPSLPAVEPVAPAEPLRRAVPTPRPLTVPPRLSPHRLDIVTARQRRMLVRATLVVATVVLVMFAFMLASEPTKPTIARRSETAPAPAPAALVPSAPAHPQAPTTPSVRSEPPPAAPATVRLEVTTVPAGATVVLDGVRLGTTPLSMRVPARPGAWLKVRKRKYVAVKTRVSLEHDVHWDVNVRAVRR
jgi:hypothetical protein